MFERKITMENKFAQYKNLSLGKEKPQEVSEKELEDALNSFVARNTSFEEVDQASELGNIVNIDFEGFVDNEAFEGGKGEQYDLELGSNTFIPGFEDQLVGYRKGNLVDVNVTFPENYQAENLKGKPAVFKCKVNAVKVKKEAKLDDELAKQNGFNNVDELRLAMKKEMEHHNEQLSLNRFFDKLCEHLISNSEIEVSKEQEEASLENVLAYYSQMVSQYGMNLEQYLQMANKTMDEFKKVIHPEVIKGAKVNIILEHVAKEENLEASESEVKNELEKIKNYYHLTPEQLEEFKKKNLESFTKEITKRKASEFLILNNN